MSEPIPPRNGAGESTSGHVYDPSNAASRYLLAKLLLSPAGFRPRSQRGRCALPLSFAAALGFGEPTGEPAPVTLRDGELL